MPRHHTKASHPGYRRVRRTAEPPPVPVVVPDSSSSGVDQAPLEYVRTAAQPDPMDEQIKRMIEAAYT
ncbi:MAG: hypothetical protein ABSC95_01220 [Acetobacteraceae bacterium]